MKWHKEDGQSLVEFAIVLPVLLMLFFGMMDFGWMFYNKLDVSHACREGARYAAIQAREASDLSQLQSDVDARVQSELSGASVMVTVNPDAHGQPESVTVTVQKDVPILTGLTSTILGEVMNLSSDCTMRVE